MGVLTDMKARGLQDILITATDNLKGVTQTIRSVFPGSVTQICVVHQIRNSCRYVVWKDKKEFSRDMKDIYAAPIRQAALAALENLESKWNSKYSYTIKSGRLNWDELTAFFDFHWKTGRSFTIANKKCRVKISKSLNRYLNIKYTVVYLSMKYINLV